MANHVHTSIEFYNQNDEAKKIINSIFDIDKETHADDWGRWSLYDIVEESANDPKWAYVEDYEKDGNMVSIMSAWSCPVQAIDKIIDKVCAVQEDLITIVRYEDEMPNFIGAIVYEGESVVNEDEWDEDEIAGVMGLDLEDEEQLEEYREKVWDTAYEEVEKFVEETLLFIKENPN